MLYTIGNMRLDRNFAGAYAQVLEKAIVTRNREKGMYHVHFIR